MSAGEVDVVIPLGTGSRISDMELRWALRSLEEFGRGVGQVWILGRKRYWMSRELRCVTTPTFSKTKYGRVREKYRSFLGAKDCPERWVLMHDDMFLTALQDMRDFPLLHEGPLRARVLLMETLGGRYHQILRRTEEELVHRGVERPLSFELHAPLPVVSSLYQAVLESLSPAFPSPASRTMYGNALLATEDPPFRVQFSRDQKLLFPASALEILRRWRPWFSVGDKFLTLEGRRALGELYPSRSRWEKR